MQKKKFKEFVNYLKKKQTLNPFSFLFPKAPKYGAFFQFEEASKNGGKIILNFYEFKSSYKNC